MCSELAPRAHVPDNRIPQLMQPCLCHFILLENSHFRERVQLVPKNSWLIKNQPYIPGGKGLLILGTQTPRSRETTIQQI